MLETQLSCCGYLKNLAGQKSARFVFTATPPAVQPFEPRSTHVASLSLSRSLSAELRAGYIAQHALSCVVRAVFRVLTHAQLRVSHCVSNSRTTLYCLVRQQSLTCFLVCFCLKFCNQVVLAVWTPFSPNLLELNSCANWRDCCFQANQRAPSRRDNFFVIYTHIILFFRGLAF